MRRAGLGFCFLQTPEDMFSCVEAHIMHYGTFVSLQMAKHAGKHEVKLCLKIRKYMYKVCQSYTTKSWQTTHSK